MRFLSLSVLLTTSSFAFALVCSSQTIVTTSTTTATSYTGVPTTSYMFLPGSPPVKRDVEARAACDADNCLRALRATKVLSSAQAFCSSYTTTINNPATFPTYVPAECNASRVSSACSCLPTTSATCGSPVTSTAITTATVTSSSPAVTETIYPCASPVNFQGPTYGDASSTSDLGLSNSLLYSDTPAGASAVSCCNACYFDIANCVQAYWYFYQGCVVSIATNISPATGENVSSSCPNGGFGGLTYGPDVSPAFRSTGNIAGPCGVKYTNF